MSELGTIQERVQRGVEWLDNQFGIGNWEDRVVLNNFQLSHCERCVLGWCFREEAANNGYDKAGFDYATDKYFLRSEYYGFDIEHTYSDTYEASRSREYKELQNEWVKVIKARREARVHEDQLALAV